MPDAISLTPIVTPDRPTAADLVFDALHAQVLTLDLPPGTRLSEAEVARQMGVSRQPVRDAFWRLSKLGFLLIRPQRATTVTQISEAAVHRARFVRTALEAETVRTASTRLGPEDLAALETLVARQESAVAAGDSIGFQALDDAFHQEICTRAGLDFAWSLIREHKSHMDRVRYLSLAFGARSALDDHVDLLAALREGDAEAATAVIRTHLSRIVEVVERLKAERPADFADEG